VARDGRIAILLVKQSAGNAYWKKGTLAVVPAAGGAPRELADDVWGADFAPHGSSLAVVRDVSGRQRLEYPLGRVLHETEGTLWFPRVSPDGERVAFFEFPGIGSLSLAVVDRSGRRSVLVDSWEDWYDLVWSADGREIWFAATRPCAGTTGSLHAVDLAGRRRVLLEAPAAMDVHDLSPEGTALVTQLQNRAGMRAWSADGEAERELSWRDYSFPIDLTPDGRTLLFAGLTECSGSEPSSAATFMRTLDGSPAVRVQDGWAHALSPDGRFALTVTAKELRLTPTGAGEARAVPIDLPRVVEARWPRDHGRVLLLAKEPQGEARFHRVDLGGGSTSAVLPASASFACASLHLQGGDFRTSPDGRVAAVPGADGRILLVPLDGGTPRPLAGGEVNEQPVQWSPDGRLLYCYRRGQIPARVFAVDVASGRRKLWATIRPPSLAATEILLFLSQDLRTGVYGYPDGSADLYLVDGLR
jgi:dipeptidyl aminopeptidase/acylaminoacyl peptidase